jgi:hypothetical protein
MMGLKVKKKLKTSPRQENENNGGSHPLYRYGTGTAAAIESDRRQTIRHIALVHEEDRYP